MAWYAFKNQINVNRMPSYQICFPNHRYCKWHLFTVLNQFYTDMTALWWVSQQKVLAYKRRMTNNGDDLFFVYVFNTIHLLYKINISLCTLSGGGRS